jgi:GNAT superfamily N-acetyltransferase
MQIKETQMSAPLTILPRTFQFTVTDEPDGDYLKYLQRRLQDPTSLAAIRTSIDEDESRLDISLDNADGDVIAGIAAYTADETLVIELIWVHEALRGQGIGQHLIQMAEEAALARGCTQVQVTYASCTGFYQKMGYSISAKLIHFPLGTTFYRLHKPLVQAQTINSHPELETADACCHRDTCSSKLCGKIAN